MATFFAWIWLHVYATWKHHRFYLGVLTGCVLMLAIGWAQRQFGPEQYWAGPT